MNIKILGVGCPKCRLLEENTRRALGELEIKADVEKVTDITRIMGYGVMFTPALVIDEKVVSSGRALSYEEIKRILG